VDIEAYHRTELRIALDGADSRRAMPSIAAGVRSILDVGCGAGQTLIASRLGPSVRAVGLDPDFEALALGRRLGAPVQLVHGRGESLPFASGCFDMVISRVALPYMRLRSALGEMARVLRPGGTLWLLLHSLEHVAREMLGFLRVGELRPALHRLYVMANGFLANAAGIEIPSPVSGRYESFQTVAGMRRQLAALGFENFKARDGQHFTFTATKVCLQ
jgi:SAM-dependent methyltransferase